MQAFKRSKRILKSTAVTGTVAALTLTPTAAVFAHGGGHDNGSRDNKQASTAQQSQQDKQKNKGNFNDWFNRNKNRQKLTCTQRQDILNQRAAAIKDKDTKKLNGLNIVYTGVQTYVSSGGITVDNYDTMNTRVAADQTDATNAVNAIAAPQLNCDDPNSAAAVSDDNKTFKHNDDSTNNSINEAQKALNTYRKDLNTLFEAVINS